MLDSPALLAVARVLRPGVTLPPRAYIESTVMPRLTAHLRSKIVASLAGSAAVALSTEVWHSADATAGWVTVRAHTLSAKFQQSAWVLTTTRLPQPVPCLDCDVPASSSPDSASGASSRALAGPRTSAALRAFQATDAASRVARAIVSAVHAIETEWSLPSNRIVAVVLDEASHECGATPKWQCVVSSAAVLAAGLRAGLREPTVQRLLARVDALAAYFHARPADADRARRATRREDNRPGCEAAESGGARGGSSHDAAGATAVTPPRPAARRTSLDSRPPSPRQRLSVVDLARRCGSGCSCNAAARPPRCADSGFTAEAAQQLCDALETMCGGARGMGTVCRQSLTPAVIALALDDAELLALVQIRTLVGW